MLEEKRLGRELIDGRPLYQYQVDQEHLSALEVLINHPRATEKQKIHALAPVAAARFASIYEDGVPSWAHCGAEIERLYGATQVSQHRFRTLMELSLSRYKVPLIKGDNGSVLLLHTVISQAGLPSGMLRKGKTLRDVVDELVKKLARGCDNLQLEASNLISNAVDNGALRKAYQEAGHLPKLCADLASAVFRLTERANWVGGSLDPLWALPDWHKELPFKVEEDAARQIVTELVGVATAAVGVDAMGVNRILSCRNGIWSLKARAVVPSDGVDLLGEDRQILSIQYAIGQEPAGEAFRLRRKAESVYELARDVEDLSIGTASKSISLVMQDAAGRYRSLDCAGGESLGESAAWVFEPCQGEYVYKADAPVRLRAPELLVAVSEGTEVTGEAVNTGAILSLQGARRALWRVTGRAQVMDADGEPALILAGYDGPQAYLDFKGRAPIFQTHKFSAVFLGDPIPRRAGVLSGRIEWRKKGEQEWINRPVRTETGHLSFRLVSMDGDVVAERRRVFVLPEEFRPVINNQAVSLTRVPDLEIVGSAPDADGTYRFEFGQEGSLDVTLRTGNSELDVTFLRPMPTSFLDLATGEELHAGTRKVTSQVADRVLASSVSHRSIEIRRKKDSHAAAFEIGLEGGKLSLSGERVKGLRNALSFHPKGRTRALVMQFRNGPSLEVEEYRIKRRDGLLTVEGATPEISIELRPLIPSSDGVSHAIQLQRVDAENWAIPVVSGDASSYLAVDTTNQAAPCWVPGSGEERIQGCRFYAAIVVPDESEREVEIVQLYRYMTDNPHDGVASNEINTCLQWLGEFQRQLMWLDPFLALAAKPHLALRLLALARLRGQTQAEQGLRWALDEVPLFWHSVTPQGLESLFAWVDHHFGSGSRADIERLMDNGDLPIPSRLMKSLVLRQCHPAWLENWQSQVIDWGAASGRGYEPRSPGVGEAAAAIWSKIEGHPLSGQMRFRPQRIPADVDIFRTYLLAPYELAILVSQGSEIEQSLRDDLLFARYMIDPILFDDAYCVALSLFEGTV